MTVMNVILLFHVNRRVLRVKRPRRRRREHPPQHPPLHLRLLHLLKHKRNLGYGRPSSQFIIDRSIMISNHNSLLRYTITVTYLSNYVLLNLLLLLTFFINIIQIKDIIRL